MSAGGIPFAKGHGTGNDFVLLTDPDPQQDLGEQLVAALCDRHRGIGADGVLAVTPTAMSPEVSDQAGVARWFMDYRNADGSLAAMCGNGARVFAAHLVAAGLEEPGTFTIATRGGPRRVTVAVSGPVEAEDPGMSAGVPVEVTVEMGPATFLTQSEITVTPADRAGQTLPAVGVLMPNPHAVTWVGDLAEAGGLEQPPIVRPSEAYPAGTNVEFVQVLGPDHVAMRVHERGVGETLSCGTGACAAAVATRRRIGAGPDGQPVRVDVPGGTVGVTWRPDGEVELSGPAVILATGEISARWWFQHV